MAKLKHVSNASQRIYESFSAFPDWSRKICDKLRKIVLKSDKKMIEDWKWGPNYYCEGMVCGIWGFKKHVSITFFQGSLLKDKKKILSSNPGNLHNRHIKFTDVKEINEPVLLAYLMEAVANNKKGIKITEAKDKTVIIPPDVKKAFKKEGVLGYFEGLAYSHRKEYVMWITDAKKEETRLARIEKAIDKLSEKQTMHSKYNKK